MDEATLDRLAEAAWDLRCQRMAEAEDGPKFVPGTWAARPEHLKETDRSVVSYIAAEAVKDAGLVNERMLRLVVAFGAHRGAVFDALIDDIERQEYEAGKARFRAALKALGGEEEGGARA